MKPLPTKPTPRRLVLAIEIPLECHGLEQKRPSLASRETTVGDRRSVVEVPEPAFELGRPVG